MPAVTWEQRADDLEPKCEAGCMSFDGGEKKHHRDCAFYPESLTKLWHDTEAEYIAEIERLRALLAVNPPVCEFCGGPAVRVIDTWAFCADHDLESDADLPTAEDVRGILSTD